MSGWGGHDGLPCTGGGWSFRNGMWEGVACLVVHARLVVYHEV